MTSEELIALPVFDRIGYREQVIDGQTMRTPFVREQGCMPYVENNPIVWREPDGKMYSLGCYADGAYFKRPR